MTFSPASIIVDRASPVPMYYQVAQQLEYAIESGELPPGSRLDGELAFADQLGVSRPTLRRAIEYLVDRGYLVRRRAVGTQVVHPKVRRPMALSSLYEDLATSRKNPRTKVLSIARVQASDAAAHALGLEDGAEVLAMERLRYADGQPLAVMRNWLPLGWSRPGCTSSCGRPGSGCTWPRRPSAPVRPAPPRPSCWRPTRASRC
jgi:DNA-binding GntR family transcriptional regulator